ncbi:MAG: hypothetical protein A2157_17390 [Deltaproteobacteria bacterium RBG_16_47_11]|nr:MAG: hypothetical protein A2157_17390 [Deltaproteobacteria bacterium RBG_16_47_11]
MDQIIINFLSELELGELQTFKNMAIIPLFSSMNHTPQYLSLGEAMGKGLLTITEVNQAGAVPELKVVNKADIPVLLLDGEELAGAKQNRVLNTTILLMEKSETIIPVSCTEQGRWDYATSAFAESGNIMNQMLRAKNISSVHLSLKEAMSYRGNQREVWDGIQELSAEAKVQSRTGAMRDVYEDKKADLDGYLKAFQYVPHQKGILAMINGRVMGLDILSLEAVYEVLHPKLVRSYAMDALLQQPEKVDSGSVEKVKTFIGEARLCKEEKFKSIGHGWDHRFEGPTTVGSALVHQEKVIHMAFFGMTESEKVGKMSSASHRRRYRV